MSDDKKSNDMRALYAAMVARHQTLNQLLWQAPVIAFAAQAFLLTIAFDMSKHPFYRIVSGLMSTIVSYLSWHLFVRHGALESALSKKMEQFEIEHFGVAVHDELKVDGSDTAKKSARAAWAPWFMALGLAGIIPILHVLFCFFMSTLDCGTATTKPSLP